jgi:hypothetical protein
MLERILFIKSDPESNPKASILRKIIWSVLIIMTLSFSVNMFIMPENIPRYTFILFLLWTISLLILALTQKGYAYFSAFFYVSFLITMIFGFSWTGGGIKGHGMKILPLIVLTAGLTLGKKEIWVFGFISILGGLGFVLADQFNILQVKGPLGQSSVTNWIYLAACIILICALENMSVEELRKALSKSKKELILRKQSEDQLKEKNKKLLEIAFLQSHMVRGPVASILGLVDLIKTDNPEDPANTDLIPVIGNAAKQLDAIIQEIVRKTEEVEELCEITSEPEPINA